MDIVKVIKTDFVAKSIYVERCKTTGVIKQHLPPV